MITSKSRDEKKTPKQVKKTSLIHRPLFISAVVVLLIALAFSYIYKLIATPPEKPKLDLEQWWGPYPINLKQDYTVHPFVIEFREEVVNDLRDRLLHTRPFTPPLRDKGFSYGFNTFFLSHVLDYWRNKYNLEERLIFLNKYNHFTTNIQGLDIHFMHVKPQAPDNVTVVPLLMIHGWPGSIREFYEVIPKLTMYRPDQNFVFEVIAPSLPGYGFSQAPIQPGLGAMEISVIMRNLMQRVGHDRYYIQGGDFGHVIGSAMATLFPENVLGFHTNMPIILYHPLASAIIAMGSLWPGLLVESKLQDRMYPLSNHLSFLMEELGFLHLQATRPDTLGVALSDSPAGLAAYILEKFSSWTHRDKKRSGDGGLLDKFTLTQLLDNIMIYWTTNCITSSMRLYAETFTSPLFYVMDQIPTEVPTWGIQFKHDIYFYPNFILRMKYKNYLQSTVVNEGGHFAALENPDLLANDVYDAVEMFRAFNSKIKKEPSQGNPYTARTVYEFTVRDIKGRDVKLEKYRGHVLIIVNVASRCGYTDNHYDQLNKLYENYEARGLRILAFPCNQFAGQEPGSSRDILEFTKSKRVKFDIFEKVDVNGENAHPLWTYLKRIKGGTLGDFIKWNFSKFIIDRNGVPVERFGANVNPMDLKPYLDKYW